MIIIKPSLKKSSPKLGNSPHQSSPKLGEVPDRAVGCVKPRNNSPLFSYTLPCSTQLFLSATFGGKSSTKATARISVGSDEQKSLKRMLRNQSV